MGSGNPVADARLFASIVDGLDTCDGVVEAWRKTQSDRVAEIADRLTTGTHLIDAAVDKPARTITVLTEMGDAIELAWTAAKDAIALFLLVNSGEAEVVAATVDPDGRLLLTVTDGKAFESAQFDPLSINTLGFFD